MKKTLDTWNRLPQMEEAHNGKGPIYDLPEDQKYELQGRIIGDFEKHVAAIDWSNPEYCKLITENTKSSNYDYSNGMKEMGYGYHNTTMEQIIISEPVNEAHEFFLNIAKATRMENVEFMACKMPPGNMTPWHQDFFCSYRIRWGLDHITDEDRYQHIKRYWMPMGDWKTGHFYQSNQTIFGKWKAGELYAGPGDTPHLAVNAGTENRYFAQITGTITDDMLGSKGYEEIVID